jgi:L-fuculose-phosphate aldolase
MQSHIDQLKETFVIACRILANEGLVEAAFNVSCRFDNDKMMINPVTSPTLVTKDNISTNSLDEQPVMGTVHPSIYKAREDVNAIVHVHPPYAIAFSTLGEEFIPVHHYGCPFHGKIKVYKSPGQVKTAERGDAIAKVLGDGRAVLQQGHGTIVVGKDLKEALLATIYLEEAMKINFLANQMGTPDYISRELSEKITGQILKQRSQDKAWNHYVDKLSR